MNAAEFMASFSTAGRLPGSVTLYNVGTCSTGQLRAKLTAMTGFSERSGCPLMPWEADLCAAIGAELASRTANL